MKTIFTTILFFIITTFTIAQSSLDSGIVAFYPFNGNANDESGNGNDGTIANAVLISDRFNQNDGAYYFNGSDARIEIPGSSSLNIDNQISISAWVKPEEIQTSGDRMILGKSNYSNATNYIFRIVPNGYIQWEYAPFLYTISNPLTANTWYHVVLTSDSTNGLKQIFINGDLIVSQVLFGSGSFGNVTNPLTIGAAKYFGTSWAEFFKGRIDDVRIFNRILNDTEVLTLYQDSTTFLPALIDSVYPHQNSNYLTTGENIRVFFSQQMIESTFTYNSVSTHGNLTGSYELSFSYQSSTNILEITPTVPFKYGEQITVTLDSSIQSVSGVNLSPFILQFNVKPEMGSVKFAVADSFQLNFPPRNIVSGDFNNDNKIDVIVSNYDSSKYTILLNNGSGGFTLGEEMTGEFKPYSISFTDMDNDRDLDMIVSTYEQNKIRILGATGQGTFWWLLPTLDVTLPIATCPGDFDGDGDNDFVALCNTGHAIFYRNDGPGVFTPSDSTAINIPATIRNVIGDIDNDGDLDIIAGHSDYFGQFKILRNDGNGGFTSEPGMNIGAHPDEFAGGDFDGDYDLDFVHCSWYMDGISLILNDGQGNYNDYLNLGNVGGQTRNPVVNDFDGDGDQDFVGVFNNNNVGIVKNNAHPNYELSLSYPIPGLKGLAAADFDNNGSIDLVGISNTTNQIKFLRNISDSLIAYFPFNGNANDESIFANDGTVVGASLTYDRYANADNAYNFNGVSDRIYVPDNSIYDFDFGDFTISSWINISSISTARIVSAGFNTNDNIWGLGFGTNPVWGTGNRINYFVYSNNDYRDFSSNEITDYSTGVWTFVTATKINDQIRFYQNGLPVGETTINYPSNSNSYMSIGCRQVTSNSFIEFLNGKIDEVKIFNTSFTDQQINGMYLATTTAPVLIIPVNNTVIDTLQPTFDWDSTVTTTNYNIFVSTDSTFATLILDQNTSSSSYQIASGLLQPNIKYFWKVRAINDGGIGPWSEVYNFRTLLTDVEDETQLPKEFALMQNYPNPFNPSTTITYHLPKTARVELKIYDVLGNEIATLANEEKPAGIYHIQFNLASGIRNLASGIFFYQLKAGEFVQTRKMNFIK